MDELLALKVKGKLKFEIIDAKLCPYVTTFGEARTIYMGGMLPVAKRKTK